MLGLGFQFAGELWITRKYWTSFTYGHKFGFLDHEGPNNNSRFRFKAGYRYLAIWDFFMVLKSMLFWVTGDTNTT